MIFYKLAFKNYMFTCLFEIKNRIEGHKMKSKNLSLQITLLGQFVENNLRKFSEIFYIISIVCFKRTFIRCALCFNFFLSFPPPIFPPLLLPSFLTFTRRLLFYDFKNFWTQK